MKYLKTPIALAILALSIPALVTSCESDDTVVRKTTTSSQSVSDPVMGTSTTVESQTTETAVIDE